MSELQNWSYVKPLILLSPFFIFCLFSSTCKAGRETVKDREIERSFVFWFSSPEASTATAEADQNQEPGIVLRSLLWVAGAQVFEPLVVAP